MNWLLCADAQFRKFCLLVAAPLALLGLRLILAYEFIESGLAKLHGENWFADLLASGAFPFPFSVIPADVSWFLATWLEIGGGVLLLVGLGTRYVALSLMLLTWVAAYSVHFPGEWQSLAEFWRGYAISDDGFGNYKLALLYFLMLFPLLGLGAGRLSLDQLIVRWCSKP